MMMMTQQVLGNNMPTPKKILFQNIINGIGFFDSGSFRKMDHHHVI